MGPQKPIVLMLMKDELSEVARPRSLFKWHLRKAASLLAPSLWRELLRGPLGCLPLAPLMDCVHLLRIKTNRCDKHAPT